MFFLYSRKDWLITGQRPVTQRWMNGHSAHQRDICPAYLSLWRLCVYDSCMWCVHSCFVWIRWNGTCRVNLTDIDGDNACSCIINKPGDNISIFYFIVIALVLFKQNSNTITLISMWRFIINIVRHIKLIQNHVN